MIEFKEDIIGFNISMTDFVIVQKHDRFKELGKHDTTWIKCF